MKILVASILFLTVACVGFVIPIVMGPNRNQPIEQAPLVFEKTTYDLGTTRQQETKQVSLSLVNTSERPIRVTGIRSTCGCAVIQNDIVGKVIEAGAREEIAVEMKTGEIDGRRSSAVAVIGELSANEDNVYASCVVKTVVKPDYRVVPKSVDFGKMTRGKTAKRRLFLQAIADTDVKILSLRCTSPSYSVSLPEDGDGAAIDVEFLVPEEIGQHRRSHKGFVEVTTDSTRLPKYRVAVTALLDVPMRSAPSKLVFIDQGSPSTIELTAFDSTQPTSITKIETSCDDVIATTSDDQLPATIEVTLGEYYSQESATEHFVRVTCDIDGQTETLTTPVHLLKLDKTAEPLVLK